MKVLDVRALAAEAVSHAGRPATALIHDCADARVVVFRIDPGQEVPVQGGQRRDAGRAGAHDPRGLAVVVGDPVQDQVLLGREVPEQGRLGDLGPGRDVSHRHVVEPAREEQGDRGVRDGVTSAFPLAGPQPGRLCHAYIVTFLTELHF